MKVLVAKFLERSMVLVTDEGTYWTLTKHPLLMLGVTVLHPMEHTPERPRAVMVSYPKGGPLRRIPSACVDPVVVCLARRYFDSEADGKQPIPDELEALAEIQSGKNGWPKPDPSIRVVA